MTYILGLHINGGLTSSSIMKDGEILFASSEERFCRVKKSKSFPFQSIDFCLNSAGVNSLAELDAIAISWNPAVNMTNINLSGFTEWRRYDPEWLYIVPNNLLSISKELSKSDEYLKMQFGNSKCPIYYVQHHLSHIYHAVFQSKFKSGVAIAVDEYSELNAASVAKFDENNCKIFKTIEYPHSLGVFYAAITEYLGFEPNSDEWKVMGASAYGKDDKYYESLKKIFNWNEEEQQWLLNCNYIEHSNLKKKGYLNKRLFNLLGIPPRIKGGEISQEYFDLAFCAQTLFEENLFKLLECSFREAPSANLAASGGCFMNSLANGKIIKRTSFENLFIPYAASDNGGAMGSALYVWHKILNKKKHDFTSFANPYLGNSYSEDELLYALKKGKLNYKKNENFIDEVSKLISNGNLVGWFHGKAEFGERALGARSILADPRKKEVKSMINNAVKFRESFRPFAPAILEEFKQDWFEIPKKESVPYMEKVYPFRKEKINKVPGVVHEDGTGRLQTVEENFNPLFYKLIFSFYKLTNVPILLNTSFNVNGEPIVNTPNDAIKTFYTSGLDVLSIGNFLIYKN